MKIILLAETVVKIAKRFGVGVKDIKHITKALKINRADTTETPKGELDYSRLLGFITTVVSIIAGVAYSFGKIDQEVYDKLIKVLVG